MIKYLFIKVTKAFSSEMKTFLSLLYQFIGLETFITKNGLIVS